MDRINNPFSPGAGAPPPELVGKDPILEEPAILLERIKRKRPEKRLQFLFSVNSWLEPFQILNKTSL